ncbi:MAG: helix-turn-helix domain-containing protein [Lachnospiraceae bacterium]|jgi:xylan 1,4-beta-xylosidase|nr:helix-turn-helix domain-containing protein [Lachnospiraceae bacterium]
MPVAIIIKHQVPAVERTAGEQSWQSEQEPQTGTDYAYALRFKDLLLEIHRRYEFITFSEAAEYMRMSEAYFSRFFKKYFGMTFSDYLNLVKIDKAVELLRQNPDLGASELMLQCGFNSLRHFYRVFKNNTGYAPQKLPSDYTTNLRIPSEDDSFDPTLPVSVLL